MRRLHFPCAGVPRAVRIRIPAIIACSLLAGYAGLKQREATIPAVSRPRLPETAARLVELYTAWGKPAEAEKWRAVRSEYPLEQAPSPRK